jgi:hypothetical protein
MTLLIMPLYSKNRLLINEFPTLAELLALSD